MKRKIPNLNFTRLMKAFLTFSNEKQGLLRLLEEHVWTKSEEGDDHL